MTAEKMLELVKRYRGALRCWGCDAAPLYKGPDPFLYEDHELSENHCITLLDNAEVAINMGELQKALSWIEFVQHKLYEIGYYDLMELSEHSGSV